MISEWEPARLPKIIAIVDFADPGKPKIPVPLVTDENNSKSEMVTNESTEKEPIKKGTIADIDCFDTTA